MLKVLAPLFLVLGLVSCGGKAGKTQAKISFFKSSIAGLGTDADGGLMLWGRGPNEDFAHVVDTSAPSLSFEVSNGSWTFWAVAWQKSTYDMDGIPKCAIANADFNGGASAIELTLSNANCQDTDFSIQALNGITGSKTFPTVDIVSCNQLSGIVNQTSHTAECAYNNGKKGYALSYEIVYPEYKGANFTGVELVSDCQEVPNADSSPTAPFNSLPVPGNGKNPFGVIVRAWLDSTDCGTTNPEKGYIDDFFPLGLNQNQVAIRYNGGSETIRLHQLTTELDICQGLRLDTIAGFSPFASGRGDNRPFTICTEEQFNSIGKNYGSYNTSNFEQVADLNYSFNPFDPFIPLGDDLDGNSVAATTFTGNYIGNNHYVEGATIFETDISDLGFIRQMGTGTIKNLTLNYFIMESEQDVGTSQNIGLLIGESTGTTIIGVKVHGHAKGASKVGGLVGWLSSGGASFTIDSSHAFISADGDANIGGLVGSADTPTSANFITKSSASVDIHANNPGSSNIGGLVGQITGAATGTISESTTKGIIQGHQALGGLVGASPGAISITDSYSTASLLSRHSAGGANHNIGGLVGSSLVTLNITRSFATLGYQRGSTEGGNANSIGGAVGINNCTPTDLFFTGNDNSGSGGCGTAKTLAQLYDQTTYTGGSWAGNISFSDLTQTWSHNTTEDDNDYPRLSWELKENAYTGAIVEDEVPYLQRPCTNNYAASSGTGSEADPYRICTVTQFLSMATSNYYALARDIDLSDRPLGIGPLFSTGLYRLDGHNKSIYNYKISKNGGTGDLGLFEHLTAGSVIENLFLANMDFTLTGTPTGNIRFGILTGVNSGEITNVDIEGASLGFDASFVHPSSFLVAAGGLTAFNAVTGIISGVEVEADLSIRNSNLSNVTGADTLNVSGLVVQNNGIISSSVVSGYLELKSSSGAEDSRDGVILSSINNINNGTIEKVHSRMGIGVNNSGSGDIYSTLGFGTNNGTISDILIEGNFNLNNVSSGTTNNYLLFGENTGGSTIERIVASNRHSDNSMGIATGSTHGTDSGTLSDIFCIENTSNTFSTPIACSIQSNRPTFSTTKAMALYSPNISAAATNGKALALGDIDGDGYKDLVVANSTSNSFSVFIYNSATDLFNAETATASGARDIVDIKIADLDGDGDNDIILGSNNVGNVEVSWYENTDGAGTLSLGVLYNPGGSVMKKIDVADYNGDGDMDIALLIDTSLTYLDNDGAQTFANSSLTSTAGAGAVDIVSTDFDNDGLIDLVISETSLDRISFLQNTTPNSSSPSTFAGTLSSVTAVGAGADELDFGDVNQDGNIDLAVVTPGTSESIVMLGDGVGNFTTGYHFDGANDVKLRDVNNDTYLDFLLVNSTTGEVEAFKGNGTEYFEQNSIYNCTGCIAVEAVDLNLDGHPEIVSIDPAGFVRHFENQGLVLENLVSTSADVGTTSWDIHQYVETSLINPLTITADWTIRGGDLEPGWSEGPDSTYSDGVFP
jgi:hypothetical protein